MASFVEQTVLTAVVVEEGLARREGIDRYDTADERYALALDKLRDGGSLDEAARTIGITRHSLALALEKRPELLAGLKARRETLRELVLLRAIAEMGRRLETAPDEVSNRDLTDFVRSIKTGEAAGVHDITFVIPWGVK